MHRYTKVSTVENAPEPEQCPREKHRLEMVRICVKQYKLNQERLIRLCQYVGEMQVKCSYTVEEVEKLAMTLDIAQLESLMSSFLNDNCSMNGMEIKYGPESRSYARQFRKSGSKGTMSSGWRKMKKMCSAVGKTILGK